MQPLKYIFIKQLFVAFCLEYEINRQLDVLTEGGEVENETRMFLSDEGLVSGHLS